MNDAIASLRAFAARTRKLGKIEPDIAKRAAPLVEAAIRGQAALGTAPDGRGWEQTKAGTAPLQNAPKAIRASHDGSNIVVVLRGHDVFHHYGTAHVPRRQILPDSGEMPHKVARALELAAADAFNAIMGGA